MTILDKNGKKLCEKLYILPGPSGFGANYSCRKCPGLIIGNSDDDEDKITPHCNECKAAGEDK